MKQFLVVASLVIVGFVTSACEPTSSPTAPSAVSVATPGPPVPAPTPAPSPSPSRPVLRPDSLSGVVSEMTSAGLVPISDVEIYCDACGVVGHTWVRTDANGAYDFGRDGIWSDGTGVIPVLVFKKDYDVPDGSPGPDGSTWRRVRIDGDTRFDFQMVRRE